MIRRAKSLGKNLVHEMVMQPSVMGRSCISLEEIDTQYHSMIPIF